MKLRRKLQTKDQGGDYCILKVCMLFHLCLNYHIERIITQLGGSQSICTYLFLIGIRQKHIVLLILRMWTRSL